ncbi:MAG TPA: glycosyltransferase family 1 protein [Candidatus Tectomicrobia bacterium]|nr:glycosyltransferase family 1 protein [Candidatus Tectomicrobia bacterium]
MTTNGGQRRVAPIAVNASILGEEPTGLGVYAIKLVRALDRLRDDLVVFTSRPEALGPVRAPIVRIPGAVRPERGPAGHLARLVWLQTAFRWRVRGRACRAVLNTMPEAVLADGPPQVTVVHDLLPLHFPAEYPRQQHYFRHFVPRVLRCSRVVVADSESTRQDVIRHYRIDPVRCRVIYPGYEAGAFAEDGEPVSRTAGPPYFLYVGNLFPHKNLERVVAALAVVRRERSCRLVIRGDGRHRAALEATIRALAVEDAVTFAPYAAERALRDLYAGAVALVFPSLYEGFGFPVLEAMACGTPVITSRTSSLPEVAGDAALLVDPTSTAELAGAMERLLADERLREALRHRGRAQARRFSWGDTAAQFSALLDAL